MKSGVLRWLAASLVLVVFLLGSLLSGLAVEEGGIARSVGSRAADGRMVAHRLLLRLGTNAEDWRRPPGYLPYGRHVLILPQTPVGIFGDAEEGEDGEDGEEVTQVEFDDPAYQGEHDPGNYRRFVMQGGVLLVGLETVSTDFLDEVLGLEGAAGLRTTREDLSDLAVLPSGERVAVSGVLLGALADLERGHPAEVWIEGADGELLGVRQELGEGEVCVLPSLDIFDNDDLVKAEHALLLVRLVEDLRRGGRVLFDEYALGLWDADSKVDVALSASLWPLSLHLVLIALLLCWRKAWVRAFPREPDVYTHVSPLARAKARAALLGRARRFDLMGALLRRGTLARIAARHRLRGRGDAPFPVLLRALGADAPGEEEWRAHVRHVLAAAAAFTGHTKQVQEWEAVFTGPPPKNEQELARLGDELLEIERAALDESGAPPAEGRAATA